MKDYKVSVIIPCFNHGKFIDDALESVKNQTYKNWEIIVVNDASTDEYTNKHLAELSFPNTKVILNSENQGLPTSRNIGIENSTGELILPLDADDKIAPQFMEKAVEIFNNDSAGNIGIIYGQTEYFGDVSGIRDLPVFSLNEMLLRNLIVCTSFFKKTDWEKVQGYKKYMKYGFEDYDFWLSLLELDREVVHIPEVMFYYRKQNAVTTHHSVSSFDDEKIKYSYQQVVEHHKELYTKHLTELLLAGYNTAVNTENLLNIIKERELHIKILQKEVEDLKHIITSNNLSLTSLPKSMLKRVKRLFS